MSVKRIIPCLDFKDGRVVKGVNFVNLRDAGDPVEQARAYCEAGADELVFLDIAATNENRDTLLDMVTRVAQNVSIPFTVGGGLRSVTDIRKTLLAGANKVSLNSSIVNDPTLLTRAAEAFGSQAIVAAIDVKRDGDSWRVYTHGGQNATDLDALDWASTVERLGAGEILITSMDRDGTLLGYDCPLLSAVSQRVKLPIIASGGAGSVAHCIEACESGADAVLIASLLHDGTLTIGEVKRALHHAGIPIRMNQTS